MDIVACVFLHLVIYKSQLLIIEHVCYVKYAEAVAHHVNHEAGGFHAI